MCRIVVLYHNTMSLPSSECVRKGPLPVLEGRTRVSSGLSGCSCSPARGTSTATCALSTSHKQRGEICSTIRCGVKNRPSKHFRKIQKVQFAILFEECVSPTVLSIPVGSPKNSCDTFLMVLARGTCTATCALPAAHKWVYKYGVTSSIDSQIVILNPETRTRDYV